MRLAGHRYAAAAFAAASLVAALGACGGSGPTRAPAKQVSGTAPVAPAQAGGGDFAWLVPSQAPAGWPTATIASGQATLAYPAGWTKAVTDPGTVTASRVGAHGLIDGYLNVTPRQGAETVANWSTFRPRRNGEDGDAGVRRLSAATGLRFRDATGSCVVDQYLSKVGRHPYRELACIVQGRRATSVIIAAAPPTRWSALAPTLQRSVSAFIQR